MNITERKPYSPGEILAEEFMEPLKLKQGDLAERLGIDRKRINGIVRGRWAITPDTAIRLSKAFGTSPDFWLNLQAKYDLWTALHDERHQGEYEQIQRVA